MNLLLLCSKENFERVKESLFKDEIVSKASIKYKSAEEFGKEGYYFLISGNEEQIGRTREIIKDLAEEVEKEEEKIISSFEKEEEKAIEGLGNILG